MGTSLIDAPRRFFVYCHDGVGVGHLNRSLAICERLGQRIPSATFLLATGTPYIPLFRPIPRVDYIKLPAIAKKDNRTYHGKYLNIGAQRLMHCREALLRDVVQHFDPHVVIVDKAPVGVCRELVPSLCWLRENRPSTRVVFGMRDIEDGPEATIEQWKRDGVDRMLEECYHEIWVYGMRDLFDVASEYRLSASIQDKLHYMGYITQDACTHEDDDSDCSKETALVTVGGGTDGEFLLRTYLEGAAKVVARKGMRSTIVGGPDLPSAAASELRRLASAIHGVEWVDFEQCMDCRIRDAKLVVTMGGYNTLCQIARNRKPAIVLPRIKPRLEQAIRARLWEQRGAVNVLEPASVTPASLGEMVGKAMSNGCDTTTPALDLGGLDRVCERIVPEHLPECHDATALSV